MDKGQIVQKVVSTGSHGDSAGQRRSWRPKPWRRSEESFSSRQLASRGQGRNQQETQVRFMTGPSRTAASSEERKGVVLLPVTVTRAGEINLQNGQVCSGRSFRLLSAACWPCGFGSLVTSTPEWAHRRGAKLSLQQQGRRGTEAGLGSPCALPGPSPRLQHCPAALWAGQQPVAWRPLEKRSHPKCGSYQNLTEVCLLGSEEHQT